MCLVDESRQALSPEGQHARSSGSLWDSHEFINFEDEGILCLCMYLSALFLKAVLRNETLSNEVKLRCFFSFYSGLVQD